MQQKLLTQTKKLIEAIPQDKLKVVYLFVSWIASEQVSQKELKSIMRGEQELKRGLAVSWRQIARTI